MNTEITLEAEEKLTLSEGQDMVVTRPQTMASAEAQQIRAFMMERVSDQNFDVAKLQAFFDLQVQVEDRDAKRLYTAARVRLNADIPTVKKDGTLEYDDKKNEGQKIFIAKYARWEDIERVLAPILGKHGFVMTFRNEPRDGGGLLMRCVLTHEAGHSDIGDALPVPMDKSGGKNDIQAYGSAMSYGMRYTARAMGLFRVEGEDDDGVAGGGQGLNPDQAIRIKDMILELELDPKEWIAEHLTYAADVQRYNDIHQEDFVRLMRLLMSTRDRVEAAAAEGMKL